MVVWQKNPRGWEVPWEHISSGIYYLKALMAQVETDMSENLGH